MAVRGTGTRHVIDYDVPVAMRDGVILYANVYRPASAGRYPVILIRGPYGKLTMPQGHESWFDVLGFVRAGYAVVVQDTRGTGSSEGSFRVLVDDGVDGVDSVVWAATQEWSNGAVGMAGGSYLGATQLLAAGQAPAELRAIAPLVAPSDFYGQFRQGGAFQVGMALVWAAAMALQELLRHDAGGGNAAGREQLEAIISDPWSAYQRLPLLELARATPWLDSIYGEWLRHPERDALWEEMAIKKRHEAVRTPALHVAGWQDAILKGALENYVGLRTGAATVEARANQRLIITPWGHSVQSQVMGDLWYGPAADPASLNLHADHVEWFDAFLRGEPLAERDPVRLFVCGANRWRDEPAWPLARAVATPWYLHAGGLLSPSPPTNEEPATFVYDPRDPVPTVGGQTGLPGGFFEGPRDRRRVQTRQDVVVYASDVLQADVEVTGPITVTLHVASSAPDTDFTAALVDVCPDGRAIGLADGILRLRYREGFDSERLLEPDRVYQIEIDLVATSNVFLAGHRIAVEISSSNFPRFDRNPNIAGTIAEARASDLQIAHQRIFHDPDRVSFVTLPIVP